MIQVIPSIAIRKGNVVKMRKGDPTSEKAYDENPLDLAKRFEDHGIEVVHLVDLDGAEKGSPVNWHVLEAIAGHTDLKIDFTGGISTDGDISKAYEYGADYITAASVAVTDPELFASCIISYVREKMTLGADVTLTAWPTWRTDPLWRRSGVESRATCTMPLGRDSPRSR